jgi:hypothetical protein
LSSQKVLRKRLEKNKTTSESEIEKEKNKARII